MSSEGLAEGIKRIMGESSLEDTVSNSKAPRVYVYDTSAILHDPHSILKTRPEDVVVIPEAVIEELDRHKKGLNETAASAREFFRKYRRIQENGNDHVSLENGITAFKPDKSGIVVEFPFKLLDQSQLVAFTQYTASSDDKDIAKADDHIVQTARYIQQELEVRISNSRTTQEGETKNEERKEDLIDLFGIDYKQIKADNPVKVKLLTKDNGLLSRARSRGVSHAEFYQLDRVSEEEVPDSELYTGCRIVENNDLAKAVLNLYAQREAEFNEQMDNFPQFRLEMSRDDLRKVGVTRLSEQAVYVYKQVKETRRGHLVKRIYMVKSGDGLRQLKDEDLVEITHGAAVRYLNSFKPSALRSQREIDLTDHLPDSFRGEEGAFYAVREYERVEKKKGKTESKLVRQWRLRYTGHGVFDVISERENRDDGRNTKIWKKYEGGRRKFSRSAWIKKLKEERERGFRFEMSTDEVAFVPSPNEFVVYKVESKRGLNKGAPRQVIMRYNSQTERLEEVAMQDYSILGVSPRNLEQLMAFNLLLDQDVPLVVLGGKAGTGKTFATLLAGLGQLKDSRSDGIEGKIKNAQQGIPVLEGKIRDIDDKIEFNDYNVEERYGQEGKARNLFRQVYSGKRFDSTKFREFMVALEILKNRDTFGQFPETQNEFEGYNQTQGFDISKVRRHHDRIVAHLRKELAPKKSEHYEKLKEKKAELARYERILEQKKGKGAYAPVIVTRPVIPTGKDIGYLPGTLEEKMGPWLAGIKHNLSSIAELTEDDTVDYKPMQSAGLLKIEAIAHIRGSSYTGAYIIVDEAQNLTPHEVKTIVTRAGEGTKVILLGDPAQIDNPYLDRRSSGLTFVTERFRASREYGHLCGYVELQKGERSELSDAAAKLL